MPLHAVEDVDDALDATRAFLTPVDQTTWAKLAVVVLFVGGTGLNVFPFSAASGNGAGQPAGEVTDVPLDQVPWLFVGAVFVALLLVGLVFTLIGSIMEFVFLESLRNEEVRIRRYWRDHWRRGVRLFAFRLVLGLFVLGSFLLLVLPFVLPLLGVPVGGGFLVLAFLGFLPLFVVLGACVAVVYAFTTSFVAPIMIIEDTGIIGGWRRLWPTITAHWKQYAAYAVVTFFLSIVAGIVVAILAAIGAIVLFVPFGLLAALAAVLFFFVAEPVGIAAFAVVVVLAAVAIIALFALVQVPVQAYLRYYALLVLGDVEPDFDFVPDQRAAVRGDGDGAAADG